LVPRLEFVFLKHKLAQAEPTSSGE
jgi:hypothetical protein